MKKWLTKDTCSGIVLLAFSVWWLWGANQINVREMDNGLAADYMPKLLGYVLLVLSAILLATSLLKTYRGCHAEEGKSPYRHWKAFGLLAGLALYCLFMDKLGFVICTVLFLFGTMSALCDPKEGKKKDLKFLAKYLIIAAILTAVIYAIFVVAFKITLPEFSLMS